MNDSDGQSTSPMLLGILTGVFAALAIGLVVGGAGGYLVVKRAEASVRRGWLLTPVVTAATDLPAGTQLTMDRLSQRSIPDQFVTSSNVKPESAAYVLGQVLSTPLSAREPLRWSAFAAPIARRWDCSNEELKACASLAPPASEKTNHDLRLRLRGAR